MRNDWKDLNQVKFLFWSFTMFDILKPFVSSVNNVQVMYIHLYDFFMCRETDLSRVYVRKRIMFS